MKPSFRLTLTTLSLLALLHPYSVRAQQLPDSSPSPSPASAETRAASDERSELDVLRDQMLDLQQQRASLSLRYTDLSPKMQVLDSKIKLLNDRLDQIKTYNFVKDQGRFTKLNQEIADHQARLKENLPPTPQHQILPIEDRIKALESVVVWEQYNISTPRAGLFQFNGGHPLDLIRAASDRFHLPWLGIVTIPATQDQVHVPPFTVYITHPNTILLTYNWMAESDPSLGKWNWQNDAENPDLIIFEAPRASSSPTPAEEMKVRAFSVAWGDPEKWGNLKSEIDIAKSQALDFMRQRGEIASAQALDGTITGINENTKVMVVIGSQTYIDMVASIVSAYQENSATQVQRVLGPHP
jgi:hypothetical protein